MTAEVTEAPAVKLLREGAQLGGGDLVKLRDGRQGIVVMVSYMLYSGKPPEYGVSIEGETYERPGWDYTDHIQQADIEEQLAIGRHSYWKPNGERRTRGGNVIPAEPRGICRRCGLKKSEAHPGAK